MTERELHGTGTVEERVTRALHAKAAQVAARDVAFDSTVVPLVAADLTRTRRHGRVTLLVAALVAVVVATGTILVVTHRSSTHPSRVSRRPPARVAVPRVTAALAAPALVPASPPVGMGLWSVRTTPDQVGGAARTQLFGTVGADGALSRALLVEVAPGSSGRSPGSPTVRVRGHDASVSASKDAGAAATEIDWNEGASYARVTVRGMSASTAATALNRLRARGPDLVDGFDPASAPSGLGLLGETTRPAAGGVDALLAYGSRPAAPGASPDAVMTTSVHASYPGYLRTWMAGSRGPDGVAVDFERGFDLVVAWPDGRQILVSTAVPDAAIFERSVRTATVLGLDELHGLKAAVDVRLSRLPLLGAATLPSGRLELRGEDAPAALCLRVAGAAPTCAASEVHGAEAWATGVAASALVDGRWVLFAGSPSPLSLNRPFARSIRDRRLAVESATAAGWNVVLAVIPDGLAQVSVDVSHGNQSAGETFVRPQA